MIVDALRTGYIEGDGPYYPQQADGDTAPSPAFL